VGDLQARSADDLIAEEQNVQVERAGPLGKLAARSRPKLALESSSRVSRSAD